LFVGDDVLIGTDAILLSNSINSGNGAIIGTGSIVTKDISPYSIVDGNPAKLIKMRFSDEIIEKLEATRWWNLNKEKLTRNRDRLEKIVNEK
jgi:virginiamycin A acetyltransferase